MKLSDFGLCKPLDCRILSTLNENEAMDDENIRQPMDIDGRIADAANVSNWRSPREQLQHWRMNRRKLVSINQIQNLSSLIPPPRGKPSAGFESCLEACEIML